MVGHTNVNFAASQDIANFPTPAIEFTIPPGSTGTWFFQVAEMDLYLRPGTEAPRLIDFYVNGHRRSVDPVASSPGFFDYEAVGITLEPGDVIEFSRQTYTETTNIQQELATLEAGEASNKEAIDHLNSAIFDDPHWEFIEQTVISNTTTTVTGPSELNRTLAPPIADQSIYQLDRDATEFPDDGTGDPETFATFIADKRNFVYRLPTTGASAVTNLQVQAVNPVLPTGDVDTYDLVRYRNNRWEYILVTDTIPATSTDEVRNMTRYGSTMPLCGVRNYSASGCKYRDIFLWAYPY